MANSAKSEEAQVEEVQVEAPEAPQGYQFVRIDPELQLRVVRKLDWNLMPLVMVLCKIHLVSPLLEIPL